jgi:hypothetical protein
MIENLSVDKGCVKWKYKGRDVVLEIENAFYVTEDAESKSVQIYLGKNSIVTKAYYYSYGGNLELHYDSELGIVEWVYERMQKSFRVQLCRRKHLWRICLCLRRRSQIHS